MRNVRSLAREGYRGYFTMCGATDRHLHTDETRGDRELPHRLSKSATTAALRKYITTRHQWAISKAVHSYRPNAIFFFILFGETLSQ